MFEFAAWTLSDCFRAAEAGQSAKSMRDGRLVTERGVRYGLGRLYQS